jgi:hypothetical protein
MAALRTDQHVDASALWGIVDVLRIASRCGSAMASGNVSISQ